MWGRRSIEKMHDQDNCYLTWDNELRRQPWPRYYLGSKRHSFNVWADDKRNSLTQRFPPKKTSYWRSPRARLGWNSPRSLFSLLPFPDFFCYHNDLSQFAHNCPRLLLLPLRRKKNYCLIKHLISDFHSWTTPNDSDHLSVQQLTDLFFLPCFVLHLIGHVSSPEVWNFPSACICNYV